MVTLTLICGLPNAGKTTYSANFDQVIHLDDYRQAFGQCNAEAQKYNDNVCVEGIYNRRYQRVALLQTFKEKPGTKICIWLDTPIEECCRRENRGRPSGLPAYHAKRFEPPTLDEGWDEIRIIKWQADGEPTVTVENLP